MYSSTILLLGGGLLASAAGPSHYAPANVGVLKRDGLMSCEQTYGAGSVQCGGESSTLCYKPNEGQTCCADSGYCDKGQFCAPVAGYCCIEGEDLPTCAKNAGFALPSSAAGGVNSLAVSTTVIGNIAPSASQSAPAPAAESSEAMTAATSVSPAVVSSEAEAASTIPAAAAPSGTGSVMTNSTSDKTPYVQVSVARKEEWRFVWMTFGIGLVGLFMASC